MTDFIVVSEDGYGFTVGRGGERFVPFGANYFDPKTGWAPKIWSRFDEQRVRRQLGQMASAGLNCIRVFLDTQTLNPSPGAYSEEGFAKVDRLIDLSRQAGLRIDFSGPSGWEGLPEHARGDTYADPQAIDTLLALWERIVKRYADEPTIMTWDLKNEPQVRWPKPEEYTGPRLDLWKQYAREHAGVEVDALVPPEPKGKADLSLYTHYVHFQEHLAERWVARQAEVIRASGARQMVSVGLIQWSIPIFLAGLPYAGFRPEKIEPHLDYMSVHFYPILKDPQVGLEGEFAVQRAYLEVVARACKMPGKPLVMEEFGWKGGKQVPRDPRSWPQEHQTYWGDALMDRTSRVASGWLNWGYADAADPNADISAASGLWTEEEQLKHWGRRFAEYARQFRQNPPVYRAPDEKHELNLPQYLYDNDGHPSYGWLQKTIADHPDKSVEVAFKG